MSAVAFTPGPWGKNCSHIYAPDGAIIAVVHNPGSKASDYPLVANRDLMAAAPELYEVGFRLLESIDHPKARIRQLDIDALRAALAKARGEQ